MIQHLFDDREEVEGHWQRIQWDIEEENIVVPDNPSILYIGCGYGQMLKFLTEKYSRTVGLEVEDIIDYWKKHGFSEVVRGNAHSLPFKNNSFDIVFESGLFDLSLYNLNKEKIIGEIYRVLTPQGIVCNRDPDFPDEMAGKLFAKKGTFVYTKL